MSNSLESNVVPNRMNESGKRWGLLLMIVRSKNDAIDTTLCRCTYTSLNVRAGVRVYLCMCVQYESIFQPELYVRIETVGYSGQVEV